jgi:hypothetical protein
MAITTKFSGPQKRTHTKVDTIEVTPASISNLKSPPFQRPLHVNAKVEALAETIRADGGVIPGIMTIGIYNGDSFILDGQHRRKAFLISGLTVGYVDVRYRTFDNMADMGEEFVNLNTALVRLRPDDILRGLEGTNPALQLIRKKCPFVGYDMLRRGTSSPIVSMSQMLRCWVISANETPAATAPSAAQIARTFSVEMAQPLIEFLLLCLDAWGRDPEYARLWGALNLTLCMWLYRRVSAVDKTDGRSTRLTRDQFRACIMALSAEGRYLEYLVGRSLGDRDRSPAYDRIKKIIVARFVSDTGKKAYLPQPTWAAHATPVRRAS